MKSLARQTHGAYRRPGEKEESGELLRGEVPAEVHGGGRGKMTPPRRGAQSPVCPPQIFLRYYEEFS